MILFNPKDYAPPYADERSRQIMLKTIEFFGGQVCPRIPL